MEKRKTLRVIMIIATVIIFIVMGVSFAAAGRDSASASGNLVGTILEPGQKLLSHIGSGISGFFGFVTDMKNFQAENLELKEQVAELSEQVRALEASKEENERLRQLLELKTAEASRDTVGCEVIAKDPVTGLIPLRLIRAAMTAFRLMIRLSQVTVWWDASAR